MALRVLDGNQTATTLSSVVTGGEHIVAHSVVSLGANAIANITSAVSGSVVSVSNFPASQSTTFGAVTGSVSVINTPAVTVPRLENIVASVATDGAADASISFVKIGGHQDGSNQIAHIVHVSAGGAMKVDASGSSVTFSQAPVTFGAVTGSVSILNFPATQTIAGTVTANLSSSNLNTVTIGVRGTVTANLADSSTVDITAGSSSVFSTRAVVIAVGDDLDTAVPLQTDGNRNLNVRVNAGTVTVGNSVTIGSLPAISGTVAVSSLPAISGTVTAAAPNGTLTTRFGTPVTANTAFATSCVTNSSRKYLLIQNVTTGSNVITVGIGFTPTTTQGIQLTAGAGITFESSYIPTGAVQILSSVTASNFTILEA